MTSMPPDPHSPRRDRRFDELIAVLVAFSTLGGIFFWSLSQKDQGFNLLSTVLPATAPTASVPPSPTASPAPGATAPSATPSPVAAPASPAPAALASPQPAGERPPIIALPVPVTNTAASPAASASPSPSSSPTPIASTGFADVSPDYWAAPFIAALSQRRIIEGFENGTFQPNKPVTRAEFATMLQKALDRPKAGQSINFRDIPKNYWAASAIDDAVRMGFLKGYPNQVFQPNQQIPKVQVLTAIANGLQLQPQAPPAQVLKLYRDASQLPRYAVDKTAAATEAGLVVNYPNRDQLNPSKITTRADAAALIYQVLVKEGKADKLNSNYVIQP